MKFVRYYAVTYDDIGRPLDLGPLRLNVKTATIDGQRMTKDRRVASVSVVKRDFSKPRRNPEVVATATVAPATNPSSIVKASDYYGPGNNGYVLISNGKVVVHLNHLSEIYAYMKILISRTKAGRLARRNV